MALVTELELPELDYLAEDLKRERFNEAMNALRARGWLARSTTGYCVGAAAALLPSLGLEGAAELGSIHGIYGLERLPLQWK
jgi:hypothetical protein